MWQCGRGRRCQAALQACQLPRQSARLGRHPVTALGRIGHLGGQVLQGQLGEVAAVAPRLVAQVHAVRAPGHRGQGVVDELGRGQGEGEGEGECGGRGPAGGTSGGGGSLDGQREPEVCCVRTAEGIVHSVVCVRDGSAGGKKGVKFNPKNLRSGAPHLPPRPSG